ncbi:hypothetical protein F5Y16DRAFT_392558 [Xylariaceae sp. FL0255]|nr:hypothetical protein F5Y16DRAFT_392558 [Xylariaceae sp. FL0255]
MKPQPTNEQGIQEMLANHKKFWAHVRKESIEPEAARGNENTLWSSMDSLINVNTRRFKGLGDPIQRLEANVHNVWDLFILSAQNIEPDHPAQDRLLRTILQTRDRGVLRRDWPEPCGPQSDFTAESAMEQHLPTIAQTSQGYIWADLPFLVVDVQNAWKSLGLMNTLASLQQQRNLTSSMARLASLSVCGHAFSDCGLEIMKQGVETEPVSPEVDEHHTALVRIWLGYASENVLRRCLEGGKCINADWAEDGQQPDQVGVLAERAGTVPTPGWTQERFLFWKDTLTAKAAGLGDQELVAVQNKNLITEAWEVHRGIFYYLERIE